MEVPDACQTCRASVATGQGVCKPEICLLGRSADLCNTGQAWARHTLGARMEPWFLVVVCGPVRGILRIGAREGLGP